MGRFAVYVLCTVHIIIQVNGMSLPNLQNLIDQIVDGDQPAIVTEPQSMPSVELSHIQLCQKAVREISEDIEYNKRDDVMVNLVVNVCFPDVDGGNLLKLMSMLNQLKQMKENQNLDAFSWLFGNDEPTESTTTAAPTESIENADREWFDERLARLLSENEQRQEESVPTTEVTKTTITDAVEPEDEVATTETVKTTDETPQPQPIPWVNLYHTQVCQKAVTKISRDIEYSKRDDIFVNLVFNLCFPEANKESILKVLEMLSKLRPDDTITTLPPTEQSPDNGIPWDAGLLPEAGPGQEGLPDTGVIGNEDEVPSDIGGLPAETGPGQEGVDETGDGQGADEETDLPDWTGNGGWWDGMIPDPDVEDQEEEDSDPPQLRNTNTLMDKKDTIKRILSALKSLSEQNS